jgi:hypothetical protein
VHVDQETRAVDDLAGDDVGNPFRDGAIGPAREHAVQVLPITRRVVDGAAQKRRHVCDVDHDDAAGEVFWIDGRPQALERQDGRVLETVDAGDQRKHRPRP